MNQRSHRGDSGTFTDQVLIEVGRGTALIVILQLVDSDNPL